MARHKSQKPKDRKNVSNRVFSRYAFRSGQMHSIQGMTNFQVDTAESQVFGFYSNTGQGATEGGPGTGKALLYTPGMSTEVLGTGLKTRAPGDNTELPAKIIRCKNGDVSLIVITAILLFEEETLLLKRMVVVKTDRLF